MKMTRWILLLMGLLTVWPAVAGELKVGWINIERIFREAGPAQKATKKLEKEFDKRQTDIQKVGKQLSDMQSELDKEGMSMSDADRAAKERALANLNREYQRMQREFREDLNMRRNEEFASIQERANQVIHEIAESEKYDLILTDAIYAGPRIDITDKVLKALADK